MRRRSSALLRCCRQLEPLGPAPPFSHTHPSPPPPGVAGDLGAVLAGALHGDGPPGELSQGRGIVRRRARQERQRAGAAEAAGTQLCAQAAPHPQSGSPSPAPGPRAPTGWTWRPSRQRGPTRRRPWRARPSRRRSCPPCGSGSRRGAGATVSASRRPPANEAPASAAARPLHARRAPRSTPRAPRAHLASATAESSRPMTAADCVADSSDLTSICTRATSVV
jgi:hypothetical protein